MARSATMRPRASLASILSCAAVAVATSVGAVAAVIYTRRAVRSSGSILRNVALVVTILTLVSHSSDQKGRLAQNTCSTP